MAIDLEQFHEVFFEESLEGLDAMEQGLLAVSSTDEADPEDINTFFRAVHSMKDGSSTLGFTAIAEFTHVLETLVDEARDGTRTLDTSAIDLLLQSSDCLRAMVVALQAGNAIDTSESAPLLTAFETMLAGPNNSNDNTSVPAGHSKPATASNSPLNTHLDIVAASVDNLLADGGGGNIDSPNDSSSAQWRIRFKPEAQILLSGNEPLRLLRELAAMGELRSKQYQQYSR